MNDKSSKTLESMSQAEWYNRWVQNKFKKYLKGNILEIGCGIGNFSKYLTKYGNLTAIDINKDYINEAKRKVKGKAEVGFGDIEQGKYFFINRTFDTIVCLNVLEHIKDDEKAMKNIYKLLSPLGILVLLVPAHPSLFNLIDQSIGHFRRYHKSNLKQFVEKNGFEVLQTKRLNFLGGLGWFISGSILKDKQVSEGKIKIFNLISPFFLFLEDIFKPSFGTSILIIARKKM